MSSGIVEYFGEVISNLFWGSFFIYILVFLCLFSSFEAFSILSSNKVTLSPHQQPSSSCLFLLFHLPNQTNFSQSFIKQKENLNHTVAGSHSETKQLNIVGSLLAVLSLYLKTPEAKASSVSSVLLSRPSPSVTRRRIILECFLFQQCI